MKSAIETMSAFKEKEVRKQKEMDERHAQAKAKVESMQQTITEKNRAIEVLQKQLKQALTSSESTRGVSESVVQANQLTMQYKQKVDQISQQLAYEINQRSQLVSQLETLNRLNTQLKEELSSSNLKLNRLTSEAEKHASRAQVIENLRDHVATLQISQKAEKEKSASLEEQLKQLQRKHEMLLSDYHDLVVESDHRSDKSEVIAAMKEDYNQRLDNLTAQLLAAEDTLAMRDRQIELLKQRLKEYDAKEKQMLREHQESVETLQLQANIYKTDFDAERRAREGLNDERLKLYEKLNQLEDELSKTKVAQMTEMRRRHGYDSSARLSEIGAVGGAVEESAAAAETRRSEPIVQDMLLGQATGTMQVPPHNTMPLPNVTSASAATWPPNGSSSSTPFGLHVPGQAVQWSQQLSQPTYSDVDLTCPICGHPAPDVDSLQLHCNECIQ
jgi:inhibitor of nuclear factor kappa-B kinase subunit gamma